MKKKLLIIFIIVDAFLLAAFFFIRWQNNKKLAAINDFDSCAAVYPVMETYPEQCRTPDGRTFTKDIGNALEKQDLIKVSSPTPGTKISSPVSISGEARGYWFFEASFPIKVVDDNGNVLGSGIAQAQSDWMTKNFVPFSAQIEFQAPASGTGKGKIILQKDNPSGLPQNDDQLIIPVNF
jgi:hypothetical protein